MTLENNFLKVTISEYGAEIKSLLDANNKERMWSADPAFWGKTSPILFPIVGTLKENTFYHNEKAYHLSRHGFARDQKFEANKISDTKITFLLKDSDTTREVYPFKFSLEITYELTNNKLNCSYQVKNLSNEEMCFSIGAHPAFATEGLEDFFLEFEFKEDLMALKLENGLISDFKKEITLNDRKLQLNHDLFKSDALVFRKLKSSFMILRNNKNNETIKLNFKDFSHFGIWTTPEANFICLEPWFGVADHLNHNQQLKNKEGIICLLPQQKFNTHWSIEI